MPAAWLINSSSPETLGLRAVRGTDRTQAPSTVTLERSGAYGAAEILSVGDAVTVYRDAAKFFQGKVTGIQKSAKGSNQGQDIEVSDAWAELEATVYQENWYYGNTPTAILMPRAILGLRWVSTAFERCTIGQQITEIITFAAAAGVSIAVGTIPSGETMLPAEISNTSCAEAIRQCLRYHPDWVPWIDHTTSTPTFNVTAVASMSAVTVALATPQIVDFSCTKRDDLLPTSVRLIYEYASTIDGEVYRSVAVDKYPADGPDDGPKCLCSTIPMAGADLQIQKQRIQTRTIPTDVDEPSAATVKEWLKLHNPSLVGIADNHFSVVSLAATLEAAPDAHPDPINPNAPRLEVSAVSDVPRELLRGNVEDWMRKKVGRVIVNAVIQEVDATAAEIELLDIAVPKVLVDGDLVRKMVPIGVNATNAVTKIYQGLSQYVAAEDVPTGIAEATYLAIHAAMTYQGYVTIIADDVAATRYLGKKLHLSGGVTAWASMGAPVHSADWDIDRGTVRIAFGPVPHLAPDDFLELQRMFRAAPVTWCAPDERGAATIGSTSGPSRKGEVVGGYETPQQRTGSGAGGGGTGGNLDLAIEHIETIGMGGPPVLYWRNGLFKGTTDPADSPSGLVSESVTHFDYLPSATVSYGTARNMMILGI
jgi:hypothetical protein